MVHASFPVINITTLSRNVPVTIGALRGGCCLASVWHLPRPSRSRHSGDVAEKRLGTVKRATKTCNLFCSVAIEQMRVQLATFKPVWQQIRLLQVAKICYGK